MERFPEGKDLQFLVVGLGSMGRRRVRNLIELGYSNIWGVDVDPKKADLFRASHPGIPIFFSAEEALRASPGIDAVLVCTDPANHISVARTAIEFGKDIFVEASVTDAREVKSLEQLANKNGVLFCPSATMLFFGWVSELRSIVESGEIGNPLVATYHVGQFLPDWHPWEKIQDFYVSVRETGGCKELVPFELNWMTSLFGNVKVEGAVRGNTGILGVDIDDSYNLILSFSKGLRLSATLDVLSRPKATRHLILVGEKGRVLMTEPSALWLETLSGAKKIFVSEGPAFENYVNSESPYKLELEAFINAVQTRDSSAFPHNPSRDAALLSILEVIESK